jgi:peptidoglycan/xylan/chitin deacetylase (PgdA/CDA1 family)
VVRDHPAVIVHALAPVRPACAQALALPRRLPGAGGVVLTFDDGPHPEGTPLVLERLAAVGARATFFVVGEQVQRRPALLREIAAAGHEVATHGHHHQLQLRRSPGQLREDMRRATAAVEDALGRAPLWHRPPYGIYSPAGLKLARELGLRPLLWSRWGKDWRKFTTPQRIAERAVRAVLADDVILLHDADFYSARHSHRRTAAALSVILRELERRRLATVLPV